MQWRHVLLILGINITSLQYSIMQRTSYTTLLSSAIIMALNTPSFTHMFIQQIKYSHLVEECCPKKDKTKIKVNKNRISL
jgi:hypothetical protein